MALSPGGMLSHYRLVEKIGEGGMGVVYRAEDTKLRRQVALKVLPPELVANEERRLRFLREARTAAAVSHPNIAHVYEIDEADGVVFITMELVVGETLRKQIGGKALPIEDTLRIATEMSEGLARAHEAHVIHRDLKPDNIMVGRDGHVKILDFGLAKLHEDRDEVRRSELSHLETASGEMTREGKIMGTPAYMSPEQARGKPVDARSDLFAFGTTLYEMATGSIPFKGKTTTDILSSIIRDEPIPASQINTEVPPEMERILSKCLEKDPGRRYQSAAEVRVDLVRLRFPTSAILPRVSSRRRLGWGAGLFVAAAAASLIGIVWLTGSRPALSFGLRDWVLVTDFENGTGDSLFDKSLLTAFTVGLEQSTHANVFPKARIEATLQRMGRASEETIGEEIGREICIRENLSGLVVNRIDRIGEKYVLSSRLVDPETGETVRSYLEEVDEENGIIAALGTIAADIRQDLGESLLSISRRNRPLPQVTTASLQALKDFTDAGYLWEQGEYGSAMELFRAVIQADPDFAMAHAALGSNYFSHIYTDTVRGRQHFERAIELSKRTTHLEQLYIRAVYEAQIGNQARAEHFYNLILADHPDLLQIRHNLARLYMMSGREEDAIQEFQEVIRLHPTHAGAHINTATSYVKLGNHDQALHFYDKGFELQPNWITSMNLNHEYGFTFAAAGRPLEAEQVFQKALDHFDLDTQSRGHRSMGLLSMFRGQHDVAESHLREAILLTRTTEILASESRNHLYLSMVHDVRSEPARREHELEEALRCLTDPGNAWLKIYIGVEWARLGKPDRATQILDEMTAEDLTRTDKPEVERLIGEIEVARGNFDAGLEHLLMADRQRRTASTIEGLAHGYDLSGDADKAVEMYELFVSMPDKPVGWEPQQRWIEAHYYLASAFQEKGDVETARARLQVLLDLWSDADAGVPLLQLARELEQKFQDETTPSGSE